MLLASSELSLQLTASKNGRRALWSFFGVFVTFLYAPIVVLAIFSLNDSAIPAFPLSGLTLDWYRQFVQNAALLASLRTSAIVGAITAVIGVAIGIPAAIALVRRRFRGRAAASALLLSPLIIPYVVFGIALLIFFKQLDVPLSELTVVAGHCVLVLPFVVLILIPRLERIDVALEEAARDLGAGPVRTFRAITLPLLAPALISALLIAFTISFDEYAVASFLVGEDATFPVYLFAQLRFPRSLPQVIAVAVLVMVVSLLVVLSAEMGRRAAERRLERRGID